MIIAAVGTQRFPMDRLLIELNRLVETGAIDEPVFVQTGVSNYEPTHCQSSPFISKEKMAALVDACSMMICHAGVGSILMALKAGKKVIVVPRLARFAEHVDDHQLEIARSFANAGYIKMVEDISELRNAIDSIKTWQPKCFVSNKERFSELVLSLVNDR